MLTMGDPNRFEKSRQVGAFLGMRPRKKDSGASQPQRGITKAGDEYLRKTLVNCAHYILRPHGRDCDLRRSRGRIGVRGRKTAQKRAGSAVARWLSGLLRRVRVRGKISATPRSAQSSPA